MAGLAPGAGVTAAACAALGLARSTYHRRRAAVTKPPLLPVTRRSARALGADERAAVIDLLRSPRFVDQAPADVYASLLDEGRYHCSIRTMYRILHAHGEVKERRRQCAIPSTPSPDSSLRRRTRSGRGTSAS